MRLKKPIITILLIAFLVLDLIFFSFVFISRTVTKKDYVQDIVSNFDVKEYINNNEDIKNSVKNYKYPEEIFDYLDEGDINSFKNNFIDRLYGDKSIDLKEELTSVFKKTIDRYDTEKEVDSYSYVSSDIEKITSEFDNYCNKYVFNIFDFLRLMSSNAIFYFSIILSIALCGIIIYIEKSKGILIVSITSFLYSLFCYYLNSNCYSVIISIMGKNKHFEYLKDFSFFLNSVYIICFILSFVLLLIYMIIYIRRVIRNKKSYSYY